VAAELAAAVAGGEDQARAAEGEAEETAAAEAGCEGQARAVDSGRRRRMLSTVWELEGTRGARRAKLAKELWAEPDSERAEFSVEVDRKAAGLDEAKAARWASRREAGSEQAPGVARPNFL
jgi:hypothetical protein